MIEVSASLLLSADLARLGAEVDAPEHFVAAFAEAGAHGITIHAETTRRLRALLGEVRARGLEAGVATSPGTSLAPLADVLDVIDWCLVMTVQPGFASQTLIPACLDTVRQLSKLRTERALARPLIAVDGGVHVETIVDVVTAGADVAVVGSGLFNHKASVAENLAQLTRAIAATEGARA